MPEKRLVVNKNEKVIGYFFTCKFFLLLRFIPIWPGANQEPDNRKAPGSKSGWGNKKLAARF
jgi:hypothetical protein